MSLDASWNLTTLPSLLSTSRTSGASCSPGRPFSPRLPPPRFSERVHRYFLEYLLDLCLWDHLWGQNGNSRPRYRQVQYHLYHTMLWGHGRNRTKHVEEPDFCLNSPFNIVRIVTKPLTFPLLWHDSISSLHKRFGDDSPRPEWHSDPLTLLCEFPLHLSGFPEWSILTY